MRVPLLHTNNTAVDDDIVKGQANVLGSSIAYDRHVVLFLSSLHVLYMHALCLWPKGGGKSELLDLGGWALRRGGVIQIHF